MTKAQECIAKAIECELRRDNADDPGVRKAYRRAAAEWLDVTERAVNASPEPAAPSRVIAPE
jgi:hypothetical protein